MGFTHAVRIKFPIWLAIPSSRSTQAEKTISQMPTAISRVLKISNMAPSPSPYDAPASIRDQYSDSLYRYTAVLALTLAKKSEDNETNASRSFLPFVRHDYLPGKGSETSNTGDSNNVPLLPRPNKDRFTAYSPGGDFPDLSPQPGSKIQG